MFADTTPTNHPSAADGMPPHAETTGKAPWAWTWILFVASQVLLLAAGGVWAGYQWRRSEFDPRKLNRYRCERHCSHRQSRSRR